MSHPVTVFLFAERKVILDFADFAGPDPVATIDLFELPAKGLLHTIVRHHTVAFTGGAIESATLSIGITGDLTRYDTPDPYDVFQAPAADVGDVNGLSALESWVDPVVLRATLTVTGGNTEDLEAGQVDVRLLLSSLRG